VYLGATSDEIALQTASSGEGVRKHQSTEACGWKIYQHQINCSLHDSLVPQAHSIVDLLQTYMFQIVLGRWHRPFLNLGGNMKGLLISILSISFFFTICLNSAFAETEEQMFVKVSASEPSPKPFKFQLAANDSNTCQVNCSEQLDHCKRSAESPAKPEEVTKNEKQDCELNYKACLSSCD
jgi:hypothetical protein